jgi:hypothetical protein
MLQTYTDNGGIAGVTGITANAANPSNTANAANAGYASIASNASILRDKKLPSVYAEFPQAGRTGPRRADGRERPIDASERLLRPLAGE